MYYISSRKDIRRGFVNKGCSEKSRMHGYKFFIFPLAFIRRAVLNKIIAPKTPYTGNHLLCKFYSKGVVDRVTWDDGSLASTTLLSKYTTLSDKTRSKNDDAVGPRIYQSKCIQRWFSSSIKFIRRARLGWLGVSSGE